MVLRDGNREVKGEGLGEIVGGLGNGKVGCVGGEKGMGIEEKGKGGWGGGEGMGIGGGLCWGEGGGGRWGVCGEG